MSYLVQEVVNDAAILVGDPSQTRIKPDQWLVLFNRAQRKLTEQIDLIGAEAFFDLIDDDRYTYPIGMTRVISIRVTSTPDDVESMIYLTPINNAQQFQAVVDRQYPVATIPDRYFAKASWFHLVPRPEAIITSGGILEYYALAGNATVLDQETETPEIARDFLTDRLVIEARKNLRELDYVQVLEADWMTRLPEVKTRLEARSDEGRKKLEPRPYASISQQN